MGAGVLDGVRKEVRDPDAIVASHMSPEPRDQITAPHLAASVGDKCHAPFLELMQGFANRRLLKKKALLEYCEDSSRPRLYCDEPAIVARFASELRQAADDCFGNNCVVLMRGQAENHCGMVPSLFRSSTRLKDHKRFLEGENIFEQKIRQQVTFSRFKRSNLSALLQHYGYRTSWLDVVDTLWGAVWFATHSIGPCDSRVRSASLGTTGKGWIYFIATDIASSICTPVDLRKAHHGLSLRPHTQNGWSVRAPDGVFDLNQWVIACVEFPISERWVLGGPLGSSRFLFPPAKLDDTLRRLIKLDVDGIAAKVEQQLGLRPETLGRLFYVKDGAIDEKAIQA